jgi:hypothetical protein
VVFEAFATKICSHLPDGYAIFPSASVTTEEPLKEIHGTSHWGVPLKFIVTI